jgi:hypothetical protein
MEWARGVSNVALLPYSERRHRERRRKGVASWWRSASHAIGINVAAIAIALRLAKGGGLSAWRGVAA